MDEKYDALLDAYRRMFDLIDVFHFNSQNTAEVYRQYLDIPTASKVVPITHSGIKDRRKARRYDDRLLRLGFIGSEAPYKGLPMLKDVITQLNKDGCSEKVVLHVYGGRSGKDYVFPNIIYKGRFTSSMMELVFNDMDLLVVPSIWHETFSLVTMEALSYGTCVLVSDKVGAKDIVAQYAPDFVFTTKVELLSTLNKLIYDKSGLVNFNDVILTKPWVWSIKQHAKDIVEMIYK